MDKVSINNLYWLEKKAKKRGYKFLMKEDGKLFFTNEKEEISFELIKHSFNTFKPLFPNYNNSILNITSSISKYYNEEAKYPTNKVLDDILSKKQYKHISIMLLDGLGSYIIRKNLEEDSFLSSHKICDISAVFPPTTACAIPALCSGLEPIRTGWLGWSNYFKEIKRHVVLFRNKDLYTNEDLDIDVLKDYLPYKNFYDDFSTNVFELGPHFHPSACLSFEELCNKYVLKANSLDSSFSYLYWDNPDHTLHEFGCYSKEAKEVIYDMDQKIKQMYEKLPNDTLMIITADHGHIDVNPIYLANFKDILACLSRKPSNEGRCAFFKIKPFMHKRFERLFNHYFSDYFTLIKKNDFIEEGYLGPNYELKHPRVNSFIGDYVAVAKANFYFNFSSDCYSVEHDAMPFKAHHAGITANEMVIPLIILEK